MLLPIAACSDNPNNFGDDTTDTGTGDETSTTDDGGSTTDDTGTPPVTGALAANLAITDLSVLQGVEVKVVKGGGMSAKNAPIIVGRPGMVRVSVAPQTGYVPKYLQGVLTFHTAGVDHTFNAALAPKVASTDADWNSTFNFTFDATAIGTDTTFFVKIVDSKGTDDSNTKAQYPNNAAPAALGAKTSGSVKIKLIPIHFTNYTAGTPSTSTADIAAYKASVMGLYPTANVTVTLASTVNYAGAVPTAGGSNWSSLLNAIIQLRAGDSTPDLYYYGAFAPTSSFASFCNPSCVAGLSSIPSSPANYTQKAGIGLVYGGDADSQAATGQTMAHEIGHGHGRAHSPTNSGVYGCSDPQGIDPGYPYTNGGIGVWGYDISGSGQRDPTKYYDIMGYCAYDWISDYTYNALFNWVVADGADMIVPKTPTTYRQIMIDGDGTATVGDAFPVYGIVSGDSRTVTFEDNGVAHTVTGYYYPYDHVKGGYVLAPEPSHFTTVRVDAKLAH